MKSFVVQVCAECGSYDVNCNGVLRWDVALQQWVVDQHDDGYCEACKTHTSFDEREATAQEIFDDLHAHQDGGTESYLARLELARRAVMRLNGVDEEGSVGDRRGTGESEQDAGKVVRDLGAEVQGR